MNVTIAESAQIQLRNLREDDRRGFLAWIGNLKRWETDSFVREHSKKLDSDDDVYMLVTDSDVRIFFSLGEDKITVLDLAKKDTILKFSQGSGTS